MGGSDFAHANQAEFRALRAAETSGLAFLLFRDERGVLTPLLLDPGSRMLVGRQEGCDVRLHWDEHVSRVHAELEVGGGDWWLVDSGRSMNGSFVNGLRVARRHRLADRDVLRFGGVQLLFRRAPSPASGHTAETGAATAMGVRAPLTERERAILTVLCESMHPIDGGEPATNTRIAAVLGVPVANVKVAMTVLFQKFGLTALEPSVKRRRLAAAAMLQGIHGGVPDADRHR